MTNYTEKIETLELPLIQLRGIIVFPGTAISIESNEKSAQAALDAAVASGGLAFFAPQKKNDVGVSIGDYGTLGRIKQNIKATDGSRRVIIEGLTRASINKITKRDSYNIATVLAKWCQLADDGGLRGEALVREAKEAAKRLVKLIPKLSVEPNAAFAAIKSPGQLADYIAAYILVRFEDKLRVLKITDPMARAEEVIRILYEEEQLLLVESDIHSKVQQRMNRRNREAVMHEQLRVLQDELGVGDNSEIGEYRDKIEAAKLPEEVEAKLCKELDRLSKTQFGSAEGSVIRTYLDTCLEIPWNKSSRDLTDLIHARKILDSDHDGIENVKQRIIEYLAVSKLTDKPNGQILCLVGAPGVGKTSVAASIARALGRKYVRVSLGGVRDEAEIRGHRKTYIGAMPGRIINALIGAKTNNPLILLDEIDKMTHNSVNGDPASAMLEVLDPEQNKNFRDNFIELPFDLSSCMFIATANTLDTVPRPLLDRMEVIEMKTYTRAEKLAIAKNHLIAKHLKRCGLNKRLVKITDEAILSIIDCYTKEAGVRNLEREIAAICRKCACRYIEAEKPKQIKVDASNLAQFLGAPKLTPDRISDNDEVGAVNGLAYTSLGGDILRLEALVFDGTGKLELTGQLGDVMKESAKIALSFVRSRAKELGIDPDFYKNKDIHIHIPEGAVPKDGPSGGVTLVTAIASALSGIPVRHDIAMTGEVTLRGNVLAIGGLREKTLAAYSAGVKTVLIPEENLPSLEDCADIVRENIEFIPVKTADEVLAHALVR